MTNRFLFVGDVHANVNELEDCQKLTDFVLETAKTFNATVVYLGDLFHNHGIIHLQIMKFWKDVFNKLKTNNIECISIVGNHDRENGKDDPDAHALMAYTNDCTIVDKPTLIKNVLFCPFVRNSDDFIGACNSYSGIDTVIAHQTFIGAKYNPTFYAKDGIDYNLIPQKYIISGHIHGPSEYDKVFYVGAPRWRTIDDANIDRNIWVVEFSDLGEQLNKTRISVNDVCRRIVLLEDTEENPITILPGNIDYRINVSGTSQYVENRKKDLSKYSAKIKTFYTDLVDIKIKESDGIKVAFDKWTETFKSKRNVDLAVLKIKLMEKISNV